MVSGRGWGGCRSRLALRQRRPRRRAIRLGPTAPAPVAESSAVIGSRLAQRAGTGPGHDLRGGEVHQHGDREQREARPPSAR